MCTFSFHRSHPKATQFRIVRDEIIINLSVSKAILESDFRACQLGVLHAKYENNGRQMASDNKDERARPLSGIPFLYEVARAQYSLNSSRVNQKA